MSFAENLIKQAIPRFCKFNLPLGTRGEVLAVTLLRREDLNSFFMYLDTYLLINCWTPITVIRGEIYRQ